VIDPKAAPFELSDGDLAWVRSTLAGMDVPAKVGQLFVLVVIDSDPEVTLRSIAEVGIAPGGFMSRPLAAKEVQHLYRRLQGSSTIPLLLAANLERGGDGIALDGTVFATQYGVAATDDERFAYELGLVAGREGAAVGCNWAFAPVVDIDMNPANPITNTRTYGSDPDRVLRMARAFMKGVHESGLAVSIKHWPGDGVDGRDQHLVTSVNTLSAEDWDATFGKVYRGMIDAGADTVMAGHIMQPAYSRLLRPGIADGDIMPASLAPELLNDLLRERLGFNGLVTTDATVMAGMTTVMARADAVPATIMAGNDIFLFAANLAQDYQFMLDGVESGALTMERLDEAVTTILCLKASLGLHRESVAGTPAPAESGLAVVGCEEHRAMARECADRAVTLVRDAQGLLPLSPERHRRVLLYVLGDRGGYMDEGGGVAPHFVARLTDAGFAVDNFDYEGVGPDGWAKLMDPLAQIDGYDIVIYLASVKTASNQTTVRLHWGQPMGFDCPRTVEDVPTLFVSIDNPYHLQDVPMVKTFVNGYTSAEHVLDAVVDRLLGRSEFTGIRPADPNCGLWDAARWEPSRLASGARGAK
jgi:beta-N-acetylhexosaminidase